MPTVQSTLLLASPAVLLTAGLLLFHLRHRYSRNNTTDGGPLDSTVWERRDREDRRILQRRRRRHVSFTVDRRETDRRECDRRIGLDWESEHDLLRRRLQETRSDNREI